MKKILTCFALAAVMVSTAVVPAFAGGRHHGGSRRAAANYSYGACTVADCTIAGVHYHNGTAYSSHYYGDGHDYHGYCNLADCTITGYHGHDGTYAFGHHTYDGHYYHGGHH